MRVPVANLLGEEGQGFYQLVHNLPQERLSLSVGAVAAAEGVLEQTLEYVKERSAFGQPIAGFQNTQFVLAELATELDLARTYLDDCIRAARPRRTDPGRGRRGSSGGPPNCRFAWPTGACNCTAATDTCANTRSRVRSWTRGSRRSTAVPPRS